MADNFPLADIVTQRDNLMSAYTILTTSGVAEYTLGDRTFRYEERSKLWQDIKDLNKIIVLREPTINARGRNRADLRTWG